MHRKECPNLKGKPLFPNSKSRNSHPKNIRFLNEVLFSHKYNINSLSSITSNLNSPIMNNNISSGLSLADNYLKFCQTSKNIKIPFSTLENEKVPQFTFTKSKNSHSQPNLLAKIPNNIDKNILTPRKNIEEDKKNDGQIENILIKSEAELEKLRSKRQKSIEYGYKLMPKYTKKLNIYSTIIGDKGKILNKINHNYKFENNKNNIYQFDGEHFRTKFSNKNSNFYINNIKTYNGKIWLNDMIDKNCFRPQIFLGRNNDYYCFGNKIIRNSFDDNDNDNDSYDSENEDEEIENNEKENYRKSVKLLNKLDEKYQEEFKNKVKIDRLFDKTIKRDKFQIPQNENFIYQNLFKTMFPYIKNQKI